MMALWVILALTGAVLGYIRLAPSDPARWHTPPQVSENKDFQGGVKRVIVAGPDGLARLDAIILATPRTSVLAGSTQTGMLTYVTRSLVFGFPDYTTTQQDGEVTKLFARLRFGRSDIGVNRDRVEKWIAALGL